MGKTTTKLTLNYLILLLLTATLVALAARRLRLPYTVGLVVTGLALALAHVNDAGAALTRDLIFNALLPPLLFEAALNIHWRELRRDLRPVLTLATLGVAISALIIAGGMTILAAWPWPSALVFGVLIAATDPVAVIAMFKDSGVTGRLRLLVESESLLNDGVAAVLFGLALAYASAGGEAGLTAGGMAQTLGLTVFGGLLAGLACGGLAILLIGRTDDHLVETALTTLAAYGSFLSAEHFHLSGVLATVAAGLLMGNVGILGGEDDEKNTLTQRGREVVIAFWDFAAFVANSLVFLLIGLRAARIPFHALGVSALILAIGLVLVGRWLSVYPLCLLFARTRLAIAPRHQHVLFWGGLRGALALALALSLPRALPFRDQIVIAAFGVVAFSVIVQGVTMPLLLRRLNLLTEKEDP